MKFLLTLLGLVGLFTTLAPATPLSTTRDVSAAPGQWDVFNTELSSGLPAPDSKVPGVTCRWDTAQAWKDVTDFDVGIAIDDLKKRGGVCGVNRRTCVQIACHGTAELVLCNDNDYYIEPNCGYLATYGDDIVASCRYFWAPSFIWYVGGQKFDTDHYNVIVKEPERRCGS